MATPGWKSFGHADGVADDEADDDGPEDVLDIRQREVMRFAVGGDGALDDSAGVAYGGEEQQAGDQAGGSLEDVVGGGCFECDGAGHAVKSS